jgi:hypothetical protein
MPEPERTYEERIADAATESERRAIQQQQERANGWGDKPYVGETDAELEREAEYRATHVYDPAGVYWEDLPDYPLPKSVTDDVPYQVYNSQQPIPSPVPNPFPVPGTSTVPWWQSVLNSPLVGSLVQGLLTPAPRFFPKSPGAQVVPPLPTTTSLTNSSLTPLNSPVLGFAQGLSPFAVPKEALARECKCPPKRKKSGKPACKNPVLSRVTRDGIRTTRTKIQCQPSKQKLRSVRTPRIPTSSADLLSSIRGGGSFSPWG